jgi:hypothetical protein
MISKSSRMLTSCVALVVIAGGLSASSAQAGIFDKINKAVNKLAESKDTAESAKETAESMGAAAGAVTATPAVSTPSAPAKATPAAASSAAGIPAPANFGTVEGTNALIKAMPDISAGDFKLGMSAQKAIDLMNAKHMLENHNPALHDFYFRMAQIPDQDLIGGVTGDADGENISLNFTMDPSETVVSAIRRGISYAEGTGPTVAVTLDALRKKYGPESFADANNDRLNWFFDYQGHRLSDAQYKTLAADGCHTDSPNIRYDIGNRDSAGRYVSEGVKINTPGVRGSKSDNPECFDVIAIRAVLRAEEAGTNRLLSARYQGWDKFGVGVLTTLDVIISDTPATVSSILATRDLALHNGDIAASKALEDAKKRKAPSL